MSDVTGNPPPRLHGVGVFAALSPEHLRALTDAATVTEHAPGDLLTEEGVLGHRFHLLLDGKASVIRGDEDLGVVGPGDPVGEIGLLGGGPSTATVRCVEPTTCLTLVREDFWATLEREPAIALRILEVVCRRLERGLRPTPQANLPAD
jgi:CRP-like cAMP-binding protein